MEWGAEHKGLKLSEKNICQTPKLSNFSTSTWLYFESWIKIKDREAHFMPIHKLISIDFSLNRFM